MQTPRSHGPGLPGGPHGGAAEQRPPCPTFGARGGGGDSKVPVFSHPVAGSAASKRSRRASGATGAPSILDWPAAVRGGPARPDGWAQGPAEALGGRGQKGGARGAGAGARWASGGCAAGPPGVADRAGAPLRKLEGRSHVKEGPISSLHLLFAPGLLHVNECVFFRCHYFKVSI